MATRLISTFTLLIAIIFLVCELPAPPPGPEEAKVSLLMKTSDGHINDYEISDTVGNTSKVGMVLHLTQYIDSVVLSVKLVDSIEYFYSISSKKDTVLYDLTFKSAGKRTVTLTGYIEGQPNIVVKGTIYIYNRPSPVENQKPELTVPVLQRIGAGQTLTFSVSATDPDPGQFVTISVSKKPDNATFSADTFSWTPAMADTGTDTLIFIATDSGTPVTLSDTKSVIIIVSSTATNRAPQWRSDKVQRTVSPGVLFTYNLSGNCSDPDSDDLTFSLISELPANDTIIGTTYTFTPSNSDTGKYPIHILARDPIGLEDTLTLELTVSNTPVDTKPPVITLVSPADSVTVSSSSIQITVSCKDESGIDSVECFMGTAAFNLTKSGDSIYSAAVMGLQTSIWNTVTFVASDASPAKNSCTLLVYLKYDTTAPDNVPPVITFLSPSKDTIVSADSFEVKVTCVDESGISSVNGFRDGTAFDMKKSASVANLWTGMVKGIVAGNYSTIKFVATDSSAAKNKDSVSVRIKHDGDTTKPVIKRIAPAIDSTSTNASSITISVDLTDISGVASVIATMGTLSFSGTRGTGNSWTATVTGLTTNTVNTVAITATDSSLRANTVTMNYYINYDPTMLDTIGPTIIQKSGPTSNSIITNPLVTIVDSIFDPSSIDSVYWTRNNNTKKYMSPVAGRYTLKDTLNEGRFDTLIVTAVDKSTRRNRNTQTIILKYIKAPAITIHPVSQRTCLGSRAIFAVTATGTATLSYQWRTGTIPPFTNTGGNYPVCTLSVETTTMLSCVVGNQSGANATSNLCTLTINTPPTIIDPSSPQPICLGGSTTISVSPTTGTGLSWAWYSGTPGNGAAVSGSGYSGQTSADLTIGSPVTNTAGNYTYYCVVSRNGCSVSSTAATLAVNAPLSITGPANHSICAGSSATLVVSASGGSGFQYQWYRGTSPSGAKIEGATKDTLVTSTAGSYYCFVNNSFGCSATSRAASLTVNSIPTISDPVPTSQSVCLGYEAYFDVAASTGTLQWFKNDGLYGIPLIEGADYHNVTSNQLAITCGTGTQGSYYCVVTNNECSKKTSSATLSTYPEIAITTDLPDSLTWYIGDVNRPYFWVEATGGLKNPLDQIWYGDDRLLKEDVDYYYAGPNTIAIDYALLTVGEHYFYCIFQDGYCSKKSTILKFIVTSS